MNIRSKIQQTMSTPPLLFSTDGTHFSEAQGTFDSIRCALLRYQLRCPDAPVGIQLPKGPEYFLTILGCMELGVPYVPLKEGYPASRTDEIRTDAGLGVIVDVDIMAGWREQKVDFELLAAPRKDVGESDPLYIIYTSGSTGRPKGVVIPRGAFSSYWEWLSTCLHEISPEDRTLQVTEFTFDISLVDLVLYVEKRTPLHFSRFDGNIFRLAADLGLHGITTLCTVPNNVNMLLAPAVASRSDYSALRHLMVGGARFSFGTYQKVLEHFADRNVFNFYGPTEFTVYSHAKRLTFDESLDTRHNNVTVGIPNARVRGEIVRDGVIRSPGEEGELWLGGRQIMSEYKNNPTATEAATGHLEGELFYRTGDVAFMDEQGEVYIVGRMDDTIKTRGYRVNLTDIDSYVARLSYIQDAATIAVPDEVKENEIVCFAIVNSGVDVDIPTLRKGLREVLIDHQMPGKILLVEGFPTNDSGKVCKKQLRTMYDEQRH